MRIVAMVCLIVAPFIGAANPAPFGLEVGKINISEVKEKYKLIFKKTMHGYDVYAISLSGIDFKGLKKATLFFTRDGTLSAMATELEKNRFDDILEMLKSKYYLEQERIPFVGDKFASFYEGDIKIIVDCPHISFQMFLVYSTAETINFFENQNKKNNQQKIERETSQL